MSDLSPSRDPVEALAEEFLERKRRGEKPTLEEYVQKHPELAADIHDLFPALLAMEDLKPAADSSESRASAQPPVAFEPTLQQLGDFRIIREVGRGGMGVVYEAEQVSLGRHVALKVLPRQLLADAKVQQRFEREAKAAARLHHTNIVPVFGVGEHDGTHYYAMQFIQGLGLDDVLAELKRMQLDSPSSRLPSGQVRITKRQDPLVEDVARSLMTGQFSLPTLADESSGRDLNVTVAAEGTGDASLPVTVVASQTAPSALFPRTGRRHAERSNTGLEVASSSSSSSVILPGHSDLSATSRMRQHTYWHSVAQIGVQTSQALQYAHDQGVLHRDIKPGNLMLDLRGTVWVTDFGLAKANDAQNLTEQGDILGTLRYMPPEAFEGQCDARGDVYSLGLTLYELLTFQPAFQERDRHKLIKQLTTQSPLRIEKLKPEVPRDLATIVHKAIERDPSQRYKTARELAEDLQRFVDDEPIKARRLSLVERAWRWSRHNKGLAGSLTAVAALIVLLAVGSTVAAVYFRQQQVAQQRLAERNRVLAAERQQALNKSIEITKQREQALTAEADARRKADTALAAEGDARRKADRVLVAEAHARQEADRQRSVTRQTLYYAQMSNTTRLWESDRGGTLFEQLLLSWRPGDAEVDLRGWEWYYLRSLPHRQLRQLPGPSGDVEALCWSPGGRLLAAKYNSDTTPIRVWNVGTGTTQYELKIKGANLDDAIAFSPDGSRLAVAGIDGMIRCVDARTGQERQVLRGHAAAVGVVAYSGDGSVLVSGDDSGVVKLWRVATGREFASWQAHPTRVTCISCDLTAASVATATNYQVSVWDAATRKERLQLPHKAIVTAAVFSPDGQHLATTVRAFDGDRVVIWSVATGQQERVMSGHTHWVECCQWSADASQLATGSRDQTLILWNSATGNASSVLRGYAKELYAVALSPDGTLVAAGGESGQIVIQDTRSSASYRSLGPGDVAVERHGAPIAWSRDGSRLATTGGSDGTKVMVYTRGLDEPLILAGEHQTPVAAIAFSPTGDRIVSSARGGKIVVWNAADGTPLRSWPAGNMSADALDVSPDGKWLATAGWGPTAVIWDVETGQALRTLDGHGRSNGRYSGTIDVKFDPSGTRLAVSTSIGLIKLWDAEKGTEIRTLHYPSAFYVICLDWSPDGTRLASGGSDRLVRIWDVDTGEALLVMPGHTDWVHRLDWNPDGTRLASVSAGGGHDVKVWDAATGQEVMQLPIRDKAIRDLAWSPDGMSLAAASSDGGVRLYEAVIGYEVERSPRLLPILAQRLETAPKSIEDLRLRMEIHQQQKQEDLAAADRKRLIGAYEELLTADPDRVDRAGELAELLIDAPANWVPLQPKAMQSEGGAAFALQPDGSILVSGDPAKHDSYTIVAASALKEITGLRLEAIPHPSLPHGGSGRARENGNFALAELNLQVTVQGESAPTPVTWAHVFGDLETAPSEHYGARHIHARNATDGNVSTYWEAWPEETRPHKAVFVPAATVKTGSSVELKITLLFSNYDFHNLGCFRLSVTDSAGGAAALEELREKITHGKTNGFAALGTVYAFMGEDAKAAEAFARGLDAAPSVEVAAAILDQCQPLEKVFTRLLELRPAHPQLLALDARRLSERGEADAAAASRARAQRAFEESLAAQRDNESQAALLAELFLADPASSGSADRWLVLEPARVESAGGATLTVQPDRSVLATGVNPDHDVYTFVAETDLPIIAAIRLETLPDDALPSSGPGRASNGNFHLGEIQVEAQPRNEGGPPTPVMLVDAVVDYHQTGSKEGVAFPAANIIDGNPGSPWGIAPRAGMPHWAIVVPQQTIENPQGTRLTIRLHFQDQNWQQHMLGRLRLSVTSDPQALAVERMRQLAREGRAHGMAALGFAYQLQGNMEQATDWYARAWEACNDLDRQKQLIAFAEPNREALETLLKLHPDEPLVLMAAARRYARQGDQDAATAMRAKAHAILERQLEEYASDGVAASILSDLLLQDAVPGWTVLRPTELRSDAGATLALQDDGSIVAGGDNPDNDAFTLTAPVSAPQIAGFRLETLPHDSLVRQGPGRCPKCGGFALSGIRIEGLTGEAEVKVPLVRAFGDTGDHSFRNIAGAIDENPRTAWSAESERLPCAVFQTGSIDQTPSQLRIRLEFLVPGLKHHTLGRFRIWYCDNPHVLAAEQLRAAAARNEFSPWGSLGAVLYARGEFSKAVLYLTKTQPAANGNELLLLALAQQQSGNLAAARQAYDQALQQIEKLPAKPITSVLARLAMETIGGLPAAKIDELVARFDPEFAQLTAAIEREPMNTARYVARSNWFVGRGQWQKAADDLAEAIRLDPEDQDRAFFLGILRAQLADTERYRQHCLAMLDRWSPTREPGVADKTAKACLLVPGIVSDDERIDRLVETALAAGEENGLYPYFVLLKGLHALRRQRFAEAIAACQDSRKRFGERPNPYSATNHAIEAMAHHHLQQADQASQSLAALETMFADDPLSNGGRPWPDWVIADLLRREAKAVVNRREDPRELP